MLIALPRKQLYGSYEGTTINMNVNKKNRETDSKTSTGLGDGPNLHLVFIP
jgi:hypothetical protein